MLSHLLFSISSLVILLVLVMTYFLLNKNTYNIFRIKLYRYLIYIVLITNIVEILEGVIYILDYPIVFSLLWKLHFLLIGFFYILLCNYFALCFNICKVDSIFDIFYDNNNIIKNIFTLIYFVLIIYSMIFITPYTMGLSSFLFYTDKSHLYLLLLLIMFALFMVYLLSEKNDAGRNERIILFGSFLLNIVSLVMVYVFPESSFYCVLFVLTLILFYYFKESTNLLYIDEVKILNSQMNSSNNVKLEYLYETVHDLLGPLGAINGINNNIVNNSENTPNDISNKIYNLNIISDDVKNIINDPIDMIDKYRIDEIVFRLSKVVESLISNKNVKFICQIDPNFPTILIGNKNKLYRILLNILINAANNTDIGKITINVGGNIRKDLFDIYIRIGDTGCGFEESKYNSIYNKNENMNLYFAKKYLKSLNGEISFKTHLGAGTTFNIKLTQKIFDMTPISNNNLLLEKVVVNDCTGKRVMILDNDFKCTKSVNNLLKKYGFTVENCNSGKELIQKIKVGEKYNFVLISDNVTDFDYMKIIQILNYLKPIIDIPYTIAFTSNIVDVNGDFYIKNGFDNYLSKPIDIKKLDKIIKNNI